MIRQLPSCITSEELSTLFLDSKLVEYIKKELGEKTSYKKEQVLVAAFISTLSSNFKFDTNLVCDKFISEVTSYVYSYKSISITQIGDLQIKANSLSSLLDMLLLCNSQVKYINLVAWHFKYTTVLYNVLQEVNMFGFGIERVSIVRLIPIVRKHIVKEFGSACATILMHAILQVVGVQREGNSIVGEVLSSDISIDNIMVAREGSIITRELSEILMFFGLEDIPTKTNSNEANYLLHEKVLRPMQMRILYRLSYRDKICVIRDRLKKVCEYEEVKPYVEMVKTLGEFEWQHAYNVAMLSGLIMAELKIDPNDFDRVLIGALLHDIGKTKVPQDVLRAERKLTDEEFSLVKMHPTYGREILKSFSSQISSIAWLHHVNEDKTGYPKVGSSIPLPAAIVHLVDVYDAMCRQRDYKKPYDRSYVREYLGNNDEGHFNKEVREAFMKAVKLFLPGESLFISGIPCTMYDFKDDYYWFYLDSVNQYIQLTEKEVEVQLAWQSSMLN